ncbi:MAG: hypothetical protein EXS05_11730 [Planctomycetaceae bacterium]|nr:hypothetical protein [Planctomycetaceae bacterium]
MSIRKITSPALGVAIVLCIALAWSGAIAHFVSGKPPAIDDAVIETDDEVMKDEAEDRADDDDNEADEPAEADEEHEGEGDDDQTAKNQSENESEPDDEEETKADAREDSDDTNRDESEKPATGDGDRTKADADAAGKSKLGSGGSGFGGGNPGAFGGGGFGPDSGGGSMLPASAMPSKRYVEGMHLIVAWSEKHDTLWGYSDSLGKWTRLKIPRQKTLVPTVGMSVAVFQADKRLFAYSPTTGRWGELKTTAVPTVSLAKVLVEDNQKVFIFADSTGRWSSPNDSLDDDREVQSGASRSIPLVDSAGNSIELVDADNGGELDAVVAETSARTPAKEVLAALKARADQADGETARAAAKLRQARERLRDDDPQIVGLKSSLKDLVREAFERRQQTQRLEAEILRHRLRQVDNRLLDRDKLKLQIIDRRLQELMNSNVRWDAGSDNGLERSQAIASTRRDDLAPSKRIAEFETRELTDESEEVLADVARKAGPNPYKRHESYAWLMGRVARDPQGRGWRLRYSDDPADGDRYDGSLLIVGDEKIEQLLDDDVIRVYGRIDSSQKNPGGKPIYRVDRLQRLKPNR